MSNARSLELWRNRLSGGIPDGLTARDWCRRNGVSVNQYYYWRKRLDAETAHADHGTGGWLTIEGASPASQVCGARGSGVSLRIGAATIEVVRDFDPSVLASVLRVLEAGRC